MSEFVNFLTGPIESDETYNLAIVRSRNGTVLGRKTRGYGASRLVLPGDKDQYYLSGGGIAIVPGVRGARKELREETGLTLNPRDFMLAASLYVTTEDDVKDIHAYQTTCHPDVVLADSSELTDVGWYPESNIPYDQTPPDYRLWLPHALAGYMIMAFLETDHDQLVDANVFRMKISPRGRVESVPFEQQ